MPSCNASWKHSDRITSYNVCYTKLLRIIRRVRLCTQVQEEVENPALPRTLRFPRWSLDTGKRMLHNCDGEAVPLTTTEYRMLQTFIDLV